VIRQAHLTTWQVSGPNLVALADRLRSLPAAKQVVAFGNTLHVSGDDPRALEQAIAPFRTPEYDWRPIDPGLEDVFIHLMDHAQRSRSP
jgi:ABC-2 type transport system ATP-binding protein